MTAWRKYTLQDQKNLYDDAASEGDLFEAIFCAGIDRVREDKPRIELIARTHTSPEITSHAVGTLVGWFEDQAWLGPALQMLLNGSTVVWAADGIAKYAQRHPDQAATLVKALAKAIKRFWSDDPEDYWGEWCRDTAARITAIELGAPPSLRFEDDMLKRINELASES